MTALERQVLEGELVTDQLARCEAAIRQSYIDRGLALKIIRDERLYRETHRTFEAYCADKWDMSRSSAYKTIEAAEVVEHFPQHAIPPTESQARELGGLAPEQAVEVMDAATERTNGKPTAKAIREARTDIAGNGEPADPPAPKKPPRRPLAKIADDAGWGLHKATEQAKRVMEDDRFAHNRDEVATRMRSHLINTITACQELLDRINQPTQGGQS